MDTISSILRRALSFLVIGVKKTLGAHHYKKKCFNLQFCENKLECLSLQTLLPEPNS
jgi:hypothetical protein